MVIDVQSYFMERSPADLPARIADHIRNIDYDTVVFTVFQNQDGSNWERTLYWSKCKSPEDLILAPELQQLAAGTVFTKHTYSALKEADLEAYLREKGIEKLVICGIDLEGCVLATSYDAFDRGYEVEVRFDLSHSRAGLETEAKSIILRDIQSKNESRTH